MTTLRKSINVTYVAGSEGSPGDPGQPYLPARDVTVRQQVCGWESSGYTRTSFGGLSMLDAYAAYVAGGGSQSFSTWYVAQSGNVVNNDAVYVCRMIDYTVRVSAEPYRAPIAPVAATSASTRQNLNIGWTGRANSLYSINGSGAYQFKTSVSTTGAMTGLSPSPKSSGFSDITHGLYTARGTARVYESGVEVPGANFTFVADDVLKVRRSINQVVYEKNGAVQYTSLVSSAGPVVLTTALYSGGDAILEASVIYGGEAAGSLGGLSSLSSGRGYKFANHDGQIAALESTAGTTVGGNKKSVNFLRSLRGYATGFSTVQNSFAQGSMAAMTGSASEGVKSINVMSAMVGLSGSAYSIGIGSMSAAAGSAESYAEAPAWALSSSFLGFMTSSATLLVGEIGGGSGSMIAPSGLASEGTYGDARGAFAAIASYAGAGPANEVTMFSAQLGLSSTVAQTEYFVILNSSATAAGVLSVTPVYSGDITSTANASTPVSTSLIIEALLRTYAETRSYGVDEDSLSVWALNTKNSGSTRYEGYTFNSFAKIGTKYYGARTGGIYELTGATDAGVAVAASVNLGKSDFGTSRQKSLTQCYVGVASSGKVVLKVIADGTTYFYTARDDGVNLATQRVDLGRGFKANYFELELQNTAGGAFELASVEFTPIPLNRRI